jgi:hypothetical protein
MAQTFQAPPPSHTHWNEYVLYAPLISKLHNIVGKLKEYHGLVVGVRYGGYIKPLRNAHNLLRRVFLSKDPVIVQLGILGYLPVLAKLTGQVASYGAQRKGGSPGRK